MMTCNICGREAKHAEWCGWLRAAMAERDLGERPTDAWPWWLTPIDGKHVDHDAVVAMYLERRDLTLEKICEHLDITEFTVYYALAKRGITPNRGDLAGVVRA